MGGFKHVLTVYRRISGSQTVMNKTYAADSFEAISASATMIQ